MRAGLCPARLFAFCNAPCGGRCPHRPASAILHRTSCRGGRPCPPVHAAADKSKIDASLRASAHTCPASYRGVCRARVPYAPGCRGNPVDFPGVSWDACRGRCRAQLFATKERYRCGLPLAGTHQPAFLNPFFSFSLRKKRTVSIFQEKKEGIQNRKRIPCRHHVTSQLPSAFARPKSPQTVTQRSGHSLERKKEPADMELSPPRRKRNAAGFS